MMAQKKFVTVESSINRGDKLFSSYYMQRQSSTIVLSTGKKKFCMT